MYVNAGWAATVSPSIPVVTMQARDNAHVAFIHSNPTTKNGIRPAFIVQPVERGL